MINDLNWTSLENRRREARLTMLYKIEHQKVAIDKTNHLNKPTRQSRTAQPYSYTVPYASTTHRQQSFFPRTIRDWNKLPPDIMSAGSVDAFKAQLTTLSI